MGNNTDLKPSVNIQNGSNICVVSAYDDAFSEVGNLTSEFNTVYCNTHRYDFRVYRDGFDKTRHSAWSKLLFIKETLKDYEWVFWIDADAVFTNYMIRISDLFALGGDLFLCKEHSDKIEFNTGVMLIRKCDWSFLLIDKLWQADRHFWWNGNWEQGYFNVLAYVNCFRDKKMVYFPMRKFNSICGIEEYDERAWRIGDFIAHRMSGSIEEKKRDLQQCITRCCNGQ